MSQTPTTFNYQAVLRNPDGSVKNNVNVNIGLDIHQATETGTVVYSETHSTTTNEFGMINLEIGSVTPATFATIDWAAGPYFVEVSVDGLSMGTSELLTVPYALYAVNGVPGENTVSSVHVIDNSLTLDDLGAGSVGSSEVLDNSLTSDDLAPGSVSNSELAPNSVYSANIVDNQIVDADISTSADIAASKIFGGTGIEFVDAANSSVWNAGQYDTRSLGSITMSIPADGYVLLTHTGFMRFYTSSRFLIAGIGENATTMLPGYIWVGYLSAAATMDIYIPYTVTSVVQVSAGTYTFHALGEGRSGYVTGAVYMAQTNLVGVFIPTRY